MCVRNRPGLAGCLCLSVSPRLHRVTEFVRMHTTPSLVYEESNEVKLETEEHETDDFQRLQCGWGRG